MNWSARSRGCARFPQPSDRVPVRQSEVRIQRALAVRETCHPGPLPPIRAARPLATPAPGPSIHRKAPSDGAVRRSRAIGGAYWWSRRLVQRVPPQPPLIDPCMRFSLTRLSDGVHVTPVADDTYRIVPVRRCTPRVLSHSCACAVPHLRPGRWCFLLSNSASRSCT